MDPLLTPTTALLYSLLEPSAFESPSPAQNSAHSEPDIFSYSFGAHNNAQAQFLHFEPSDRGFWKQQQQQYHHGEACTPTGVVDTCVASAEQYITPPGTVDIASEATRASSSPESGEQQLFQLEQPRLTTGLDFSPLNPLDEEAFASFEDCSVPSRPSTATK